MDKKKVEKNLNKAICELLRYEKLGDKSSFTRASNLIKDAKMELFKPDWISVKDGLPPYGDVVRVRSKQNPNDLMLACRIDGNTMKIVYPLNKYYSQDITHWRKIDKLEV